jgi:hypothetical protein
VVNLIESFIQQPLFETINPGSLRRHKEELLTIAEVIKEA